MGLYESALATAADTQDIQAGGPGFLDRAEMALTAGATGAVISGLGSIYNTAAAGVNALGGSMDEIDTYKKLAEIDTNWANYYQENKNAIDVVGFIGGSIIPGSIAIKGLNAVRAGNASNAFGRALGFARTKQAEAVSAALDELATEGGTIFTRINKSKLAAMGWGVADQTLTAAAFETGVATAMHKSPMLADDSWYDIFKSALVGSMFGGAIGGGIDSILLHKGFKNAVLGIDAKQRSYDYIKSLQGVDIAGGDKAYAIINSILQLPDEVGAMAGFVRTPSFLVEKGGSKFFDASKVLSGSLSSTKTRAMSDFEIAVRDVAGDTDAANSFADFLVSRFRQLKSSGASSADISEALGDQLLNLKSVKTAGEKGPVTPSSDLWYFAKKVDASKLNTVADWEAAIKSTTPTGNDAYKSAYAFLGSPADLETIFKDVAYIGKPAADGGFATLKEAWDAGKHVAFNPDGSMRVNDASKFWKKVEDPVFDNSRFLNTRTGAVTDEAVLTAADRLPVGASLGKENIKGDVVYLPMKVGKEMGSKPMSMSKFRADGDVEYFTARHAWASQLVDKQLVGKVVDIHDFSLLDRLTSVKDPDVLASISIRTKSGEVLGKAADLDLPSIIKSGKLGIAQDELMTAYESGTTLDTRALAYRLNSDVQWLENAVASRFADSLSGKILVDGKSIDNLSGLSRNLSDYMHRENVLVEYATPQQFIATETISPKMTWQEKKNLIMDSAAATGGTFVTGELAYNYRVQQAILGLTNASSGVLGSARHALLPNVAQDITKLADSVGVGASFFGSSNANYGDIAKLWVQTSGKLVHKWIEEDVKGVIDSFSTVVNRLRANPTAAAEFGIVNNIGRSTNDKYVWDPSKNGRMMLRELQGLSKEKFDDAVRAALSDGRRPLIELENPEAIEFFKVHTDLNDDRIGKRTALNTARGFTSNIQPGTIYFPPIDTTYFKHFAFVRPIEGKAFGTSEVAMIFGRDAAELSTRRALVDTKMYEVITKDQTEKWFKAKELYDFDLTINEPRINSELNKSGALNNLFPEVRPENLVEDYLRWHQNQTSRLVRDAVETNYAQQIAELRKLGETYVEIATSKFSGTLRSSKSQVVNPYDDYVKTALDISKRSEYTFFHQANEFVDALGTRAYQAVQSAFGDAKAGIVTWQEANAIGEKHGIKGLYSSEQEFFSSNVPRDRNLVKEYVSKANALLANFVLRFDFANSLINIVSTPLTLGTEMASIRNLAKNDPALVGKLAELTSVSVPGTGAAQSIPSNSKLIFNSVRNFFGSDKEELLTRYKANGDIKEVLSQYHSMLDDLAMRADFKNFKESTDRAFEKAATLTGNNWAEQFTRFVSADVMRQLTDPLLEAGKLSLKEQNAYISVFVNRVQGNYISSQRPIVFQGVLGSAIGLFQTYSFNLLQQLLRHVENGDKRAVATAFGMQAGLFGLNGTPLFEAVNTHIIGNAAINQGHYDSYSLAPAILGKDVGDWLMYGTASAMPGFGGSWPSLYTRGDINPRHISILPIKPQDVPAIDASIRVVSNILETGNKLITGANIGETLLQGLEHNGINRPLAGFAQVLSGKATTGQGSLISAANEFNLVANASRIAGARPFDEALALNTVFRNKAYQAADMDRMEHLGEKVKSYLYRGEFPPDEVMDSFTKDYAASGGRVENFNRSMQRWAKDANVSVVNKMRSKLQSSYGQRLNEIMGGEPLTDYATATAGSETLLPE